MREIKFRAYDKKSQKMYQITDINFSDYVANGVCFGDWKEFSINNLLQYTGLLDKNGTEIYEGEIIKDSSNRLMTVEWDRRVGASRFIFRVINTIGHIKVGRFINTHEWIMPDDNDIEVIGNIYEHNHLIDNK